MKCPMSDVSTCLSLKKVYHQLSRFYAKLNLRQPSLQDLERGVFGVINFNQAHSLQPRWDVRETNHKIQKKKIPLYAALISLISLIRK